MKRDIIVISSYRFLILIDYNWDYVAYLKGNFALDDGSPYENNEFVTYNKYESFLSVLLVKTFSSNLSYYCYN